jgi:hypothetical protein
VSRDLISIVPLEADSVETIAVDSVDDSTNSILAVPHVPLIVIPEPRITTVAKSVNTENELVIPSTNALQRNEMTRDMVTTTAIQTTSL